MKQTFSMFGAMFAIVLALGPSAAWAESGSRTGDAADFLLGTQCPRDNGACFDPNASGQKLQARLAVTYDKVPGGCTGGVAFVRNMFVNITVEQNNLRLPFTGEYLNGPPSHSAGFCMFTNTLEQVNVMIGVVKNRVIPFFFNCDPDTAGSCPGFRIKAVTGFQYTTADPRAVANPFAGGFSADLVIAVQ